MTLTMAWGACADETVPEETVGTTTETSADGAETAEEPQQPEDTGVRIWQGYLNGEAYTFRIDSQNQAAAIARTAEDGTMNLISGAYTTDEAGTLTVTAEDGTVQSWSASSVSTCQTAASGETGDVTLALADPNLEANINDYAWYTGISAEGDAYTYGISLDCTQLIFGFYAVDDETLYESTFSLQQTEGGDGLISGIASDEAGNVYSFSYELVDGSPLHVNITLNGETCEAYAVEARAFPGYEEAAE